MGQGQTDKDYCSCKRHNDAVYTHNKIPGSKIPLCEPILTMSTSTDLIEALKNPEIWPHPASKVELVETHISCVLLVGDFAYKIKKPVDLGFLDFSTLEKRQYYCEKELSLNRRLASDLYLDVDAITGDSLHPEIGGKGTVLEYAVRMKRFPAKGLLSQHIERLTPDLVDSIAVKVAAFHAKIDRADADNPSGSPEQVYHPMQENFEMIRLLDHEPEVLTQLDRLEQWARQTHGDLTGTIAARKAQGFVRECHGDMHLGNITLIDGEAVIFDGVEFSHDLRWIDVISEIAFLVMDLEEKARPELAQRFLNSYLEQTGDYDGLELLAFYKAYRALVRAKVTAIRLSQDDVTQKERPDMEQALHDYINLAESYTQLGQPAVVITHGVSGSGKSFASKLLAMWLPAVHIRSDVERKRLSGLEPKGESDSEPMDGIYSEEATWKTYQRLLDLAEDLISFGFITIVDATFLKHDQRKLFAAMAERMLAPFVILDMRFSEQVLHERVRARIEHGDGVSEANEEILDLQLDMSDQLEEYELSSVVVVTEDHPLSISEIKEKIFQ
jgi:aminoglycoside phosphotransferase family enzyme/adenylate kinase family enzyme